MTVYVDPSATEPLALLLKDKDQDTRILAGAALGIRGDERGKQEIVRALASGSVSVPIIRAAGKLKEQQAVKPILSTLGADVSMSVFDGTNEQDLTESREAKIEALKSITGQDFGYAFYRWIAWWAAQGNDVVSLFGSPAGEEDYLSEPAEDDNPASQ